MDIETIKEQLTAMGYECVEGDDFAIQFCIQEVEQYIKHFCNISEVPACLEHVWIDIATGRFLNTKKAMGKLTAIQFQPLLTSIRDGDTTVEYNNSYNSDPEQLFLNMLDKMINGHNLELLAHRRIKW